MTAKSRHLETKNIQKKAITTKKTHNKITKNSYYKKKKKTVKANIEINSGNYTMIINKTRTMMDMNEH